jgi:hypothetical protein
MQGLTVDVPYKCTLRTKGADFKGTSSDIKVRTINRGVMKRLQSRSSNNPFFSDEVSRCVFSN